MDGCRLNDSQNHPTKTDRPAAIELPWTPREPLGYTACSMEGGAVFKFTIRDLLWLMLLAGFVVHTWIERGKTIGERAMRRRVADALSERDATMRDLSKAEWREKALKQEVQRLSQALSDIHIELVNERVNRMTNEVGSSESEP